MPEEIERILKYMALMSKGYDDHLKWSEETELEPDMMSRMDR